MHVEYVISSTITSSNLKPSIKVDCCYFRIVIIFTDLPYLMAKMGRLDNSKELVSPETVHRNKNSKLYGYFFETLDPSELKNLVQHYSSDFTLLGYTFNLAKNLIGGWD